MPRRFHTHVPGLVYAGLVMVVAILAMNNQNNLMFWILGVLAAGLVISAALSATMVRSLRVRRIDPQHGTVGEPLFVRYAVTNRSRIFSTFNIHLEESAVGLAEVLRRANDRGNSRNATAWLMHIGPGETVHGEAILWPQRRGRLAFSHIRIWTTFPFGIIRKSKVASQPQHTLIYPMMYELRPGLLRAVAPKELIGTRISHHAGAGDDFFGTREYRPGDSMRHIAWKRTARTDQLITIERTNPSPAKLRVILDLTGSDRAGTPESRLAWRDLEERAISLAASIFRAADLDGFEIGLTVLGFPQPAIAVRRNQWHFHKIMAALAGLDLESPRKVPPAAVPTAVRDAERAALVVIAPDRVQPLRGSAERDDVLYLTGRHLDELAVAPINAGSSVSRLHARSVHAAIDEAAAA